MTERLGHQETADLQWAWEARGIKAEKHVFARIAPEGVIAESNELNNMGSAVLALGKRRFTLSLSKDVNLVALPLEPDTPFNSRLLASKLGATMIVRYNALTSQFEPFIPSFHTGDGFGVQGAESYIAIVSGAKQIAFDGISHPSTLSVRKGINLLSLPLQPTATETARSFSSRLGANMLIRYNRSTGVFQSFIPNFHTGNGFNVVGGEGYITLASQAKTVTVSGKGWLDSSGVSPAPMEERPRFDPHGRPSAAVVGIAGRVSYDDGRPLEPSEEYQVQVTHRRTGETLSAMVDPETGEYAVAFVDLFGNGPLIEGDDLEVTLLDSRQQEVGWTTTKLRADDLERRFVLIPLTLRPAVPKVSALHQNFPNPFNPETWIPYELAEAAPVVVAIYDLTGRKVRELDLGFQRAGYYTDKPRAAHWDGRNELGERVASGMYL